MGKHDLLGGANGLVLLAGETSPKLGLLSSRPSVNPYAYLFR